MNGNPSRRGFIKHVAAVGAASTLASPWKSGDALATDHQNHLLDSAHYGDLMMGKGRGHRVVVAVEPNERQRIGMPRLDTARLKSLATNRPEDLEFFGQEFFLRCRLPTQVSLEIFLQTLHEFAVQVL